MGCSEIGCSKALPRFEVLVWHVPAEGERFIHRPISARNLSIINFEKFPNFLILRIP